MAYLNILREFQAWQRAWREHLPLDCLLCSRRTPGGLCPHCQAAVCASMVAGTPRCKRCALSLSFSQPDARVVLPEITLPRPVGAIPECPDCHALSPAMLSVVAAFDYDWPGELLIQRLKLRGRFSCAPLLAGLLAQRVQHLRASGRALWCERGTLVTAVPSGNASLRLRGYNPAAETGRALARRLSLEWRPGLLLRRRDGGRQKYLGRQARRRGVRGLYHCPGGVSGREVLVVDDVMTTGSTLSAIAQALSEQGADKVWGAVLARTPARNSYPS